MKNEKKMATMDNLSDVLFLASLWIRFVKNTNPKKKQKHNFITEILKKKQKWQKWIFVSCAVRFTVNQFVQKRP